MNRIRPVNKNYSDADADKNPNRNWNWSAFLIHTTQFYPRWRASGKGEPGRAFPPSSIRGMIGGMDSEHSPDNETIQRSLKLSTIVARIAILTAAAAISFWLGDPRVIIGTMLGIAWKVFHMVRDARKYSTRPTDAP
jgi:hypothetical protein